MVNIQNGSSYYLDYSSYLRSVFPEYKVQKISINAGFSCPNRSGQKGFGGCTYCNVRSFSPEYTKPQKSITQQLEEGKAFFSNKYPNMKYLAYFQSYTNTYASLDLLKSLYKEALSVPDVVGIIIGTRPDCISMELLEYFAELSKRTFLYIEYGVESTNDRTLERIKRGHDFGTSVRTIRATVGYGIPVGAHLIIGLPGEREEDFVAHIKRLSALPISSIKFHQLQILRGTELGAEYLKHPEDMSLFTVTEYVSLMARLVAYLRPNIYIDRFVSQSPPSMIIAPKWDVKNYAFTHLIHKELELHNLYQGAWYKSESILEERFVVDF